MSGVVQDPVSEITSPLVSSLRSRDFKSFLDASRVYFRYRNDDFIKTADPALAAFLDSTCQFVGMWGSFENCDQRPVELNRRMELVEGLLANRGSKRAGFLHAKADDFHYFREVGPKKTPLGWFSPIADKEEVVVAQLRGFIANFEEVDSFTHPFASAAINNKLNTYLLQSHFGLFGMMINYSVPGSELSSLIKEIYSVSSDGLNRSGLDFVKTKVEAFARSFGFSNDGLFIREQHFCSEKNLEDTKKMADSLCIDFTNPEPQNGFGKEFTLDEFHDMTTRPSSALLTMERAKTKAGFYILTKDLADAPLEFRPTMQLIRELKLDYRIPSAFGLMAGVLKDCKEDCQKMNINAYDFLHYGMAKSLRIAGILRLFGVVRANNLAIVAHRKRGWKETGDIVHPYGKTDYKLMYVDL